jgi:hypothetical protein
LNKHIFDTDNLPPNQYNPERNKRTPTTRPTVTSHRNTNLSRIYPIRPVIGIKTAITRRVTTLPHYTHTCQFCASKTLTCFLQQKVASYLHLSSQYQRAVVYNMNLHPNQISRFVTRESNFRGSPLDSVKSRRAAFIGAATHHKVRCSASFCSAELGVGKSKGRGEF